MQKPELKDFGLTKDLLRKHEEQKKAVERKLLKYLQEKKDKRKTFAIFYFLASIIVLIIILATEFSEFSRILLGIYGVGIPWVIVVCLIKTEETIRDISVSERTEIENSIIDRKLERLISDYNYALCRYKETTSINEKSLVKCEQFIRLTPDKLLSMGDVWVVFSNEYLENVASFPNLNMKIKATPEFKEYYHNLLESKPFSVFFNAVLLTELQHKYSLNSL